MSPDSLRVTHAIRVGVTFLALLAFASACVLPGSHSRSNPPFTPDASRIECAGGMTPNPPAASCTCLPGSTCDVDCDGEGDCLAGCASGATCGLVECENVAFCGADCQNGSTCRDIDCSGSADCTLDCSRQSTCGVNCAGTRGLCAVDCSGGSACLLNCGDNPEYFCGFSGCLDAGPDEFDEPQLYGVLCPGNIRVCNRPCPTCGDGICDAVAGETCSSCPADCC